MMKYLDALQKHSASLLRFKLGLLRTGGRAKSTFFGSFQDLRRAFQIIIFI